MAVGAMLVVVAAWGIAGFGDVGHQLACAFTALPGGLLLLLAGSDLLSRSTCRSRSSRPVVPMHEWLATAQSRGHAAKAALN